MLLLVAPIVSGTISLILKCVEALEAQDKSVSSLFLPPRPSLSHCISLRKSCMTFPKIQEQDDSLPLIT